MIDKNILNTGRQFEFDVAKTFAVFFMIVVHVFEYYDLYHSMVAVRKYDFHFENE